SHPAYGEIAKLSGWFIIRDCIWREFFHVMNSKSEDLHRLSVTFFDRFGNIRPGIVHDNYHKGLGTWGEELNDGRLVHIKDIKVKDELKHTGVDSLCLDSFLKSVHVDAQTFVFFSPGKRLPEGPLKELYDRQTELFRKFHFRRVGRTMYLGYCPNKEHPSRQVAAADDIGDFHTRPEGAEAQTTHCTSWVRDEWRENLDEAGMNVCIHATHAMAPTLVHEQDDLGYTPLHIAASLGNVRAVQDLIALGVEEDLAKRDYGDGRTPLEVCMKQACDSKEKQETYVELDTDYLRVQWLLQQAMGYPGLENEVLYVRKRKFGCTCEQCEDGWLSPRMRFRLYSYDLTSFSFIQFPCGPEDARFDLILPYLPVPLQQYVTKSFYNGYRTLFKAISATLSNTQPEISSIPTRQNLLDQLNLSAPVPSGLDILSANHYLEKQGKVEYALNCVLSCATDQSPLGDYTFDGMWDNDEDEDRDYLDLPKCANDLNIRQVSVKLGLASLPRGGSCEI
ncbi:hypothetical protein HETIRDRAFT_330631, partial [Heterobasidion irregulare TC 32-1]